MECTGLSGMTHSTYSNSMTGQHIEKTILTSFLDTIDGQENRQVMVNGKFMISILAFQGFILKIRSVKFYALNQLVQIGRH